MLRSLTSGRRRVFTLLGSVSVMVALALAVMAPAVVVAQATRTWVSGVGDDANPCSRTAPCKTFPGAIAKTAAGGEINCIDPGGFGTVTITKAITIDCEETEAGVLASGTNGIVVNAGPNDIVTLRELDIDGIGANNVGTGINGIKFIAGGALHVQEVLIRNFRGGGSGIDFEPTGNSELYVDDSDISANGSSATTGGIVVRPTGTGTANVVIDGVHLENNSSGFIADGTSSTGIAANFNIQNSTISGNSNNGISAISATNDAGISGMVRDCTVSANVSVGISANGVTASGKGSAIIRVGGSSISQNVTGVSSVGSGQVRSYTSNQVNGNLGGESFAGNDALK